MRVYFLSCTPAVLKLNGMYAGYVDGFERHVELSLSDCIMAEIVPGDNLQPVNFFLDESFFKAPPDYADVYLLGGDALIYIRQYAAKDMTLKVIYQTRFCGNLVTVFSQGGIYLSCEGAGYGLTPLPARFAAAEFSEREISGRKVLAGRGGNMLIIISESGKVIFLNPVDRAEFGDCLKTVTPFGTCTAAQAECAYSYDGEKLTLVSSKTVETRQPERGILHFAFFESVLTRGDCEKYLDGSIAERAKDISGYLGGFVSVAVPPEKFYAVHGNLPAAGLVYPKAKNLFEVKFFAVEFNGEKISNIYPVTD